MRTLSKYTLEVLMGPRYLTGHPVIEYAPFNTTEKTTITRGYIPEGRCVSLNSSGQFILGVDTQTMPMWLRGNSDDPDVSIATGDPSADVEAYASGLDGNMMAYVAVQGCKMATTEFDSARVYTINSPLTAIKGTGVAAQLDGTAGKLTNYDGSATVGFYTHCVVAVCAKAFNSASSAKNAHGQFEIEFWPYFLPKVLALPNGFTEPTWA